MRAAGCIINDILDRDFDRQVWRTQQRPLAAGTLTVSEALIAFILLGLCALSLLYWLNPLTRWLAAVGFGLTMLYPLLKRYTHVPQLGLGLVFSWGIPMGFAAQCHHVPVQAGLLWLINGFWIIAYDSEYAMADRADDLKIGVKSTAILFASYDRFCIALLQCLVLVLLLVLAVWLQFSSWFYLAWVSGGCLFAYQQWLIRAREPQSCLQAFTHNHWFGLVIFIGIVLGL